MDGAEIGHRLNLVHSHEADDNPHSGQYFMHNFTRDVGQPEVAPGVAVGKSFMVQSQQMQDRGVEVVNVDFV